MANLKGTETDVFNYNICRLCLGNEPNFHIFENEKLLLGKIQTCCSLQINENDGLPQLVCNTCVDMLDNIFNFRTKCDENDKILKNKLSRIVKIEKPSDEFEAVETEHCFVKEEEIMEDSDDPVHYDTVPMTFEAEDVKYDESVEPSNMCEYCGLCFYEKNVYFEHIRSQHFDRPYTCDICTKGFSNREKIIRHLKIHESTLYPCNLCDKIFKSSSSAHRHIEIVHKKSRSAACNICGKVLATKFGRKMHMRIHTARHSFQCNVCQQKFTYKQNMLSHLRIHREVRYECKLCSQKFPFFKNLREHKKVHEAKERYECKVCSKSYALLKHLKMHMKNEHYLEYVEVEVKVEPIEGNSGHLDKIKT